MSYKGIYRPQNPEKYIGNATNIVFRSLKERSIMHYCDITDKVVAWNSEEVVVPYIYEVDGREHRYFVDFLVKITKNSGEVVDLLIEYKPKSQTVPPKKPKRKTAKTINSYNNAALTYIKNCNKWSYAAKYAKEHGMEFVVISEEHVKGMVFFKSL